MIALNLIRRWLVVAIGPIGNLIRFFLLKNIQGCSYACQEESSREILSTHEHNQVKCLVEASDVSQEIENLGGGPETLSLERVHEEHDFKEDLVRNNSSLVVIQIILGETPG